MLGSPVPLIETSLMQLLLHPLHCRRKHTCPKLQSRATGELRRGHCTSQSSQAPQDGTTLARSRSAMKSLFLTLFRNNLLGFHSNQHKCQILVVQIDGDLALHCLITQHSGLPGSSLDVIFVQRHFPSGRELRRLKSRSAIASSARSRTG